MTEMDRLEMAPVGLGDTLRSRRTGKDRVVVGRTGTHWILKGGRRVLRGSVGRSALDGGHLFRVAVGPNRFPVAIRPLVGGQTGHGDRWVVEWSDGSFLMDYGPTRQWMDLDAAARAFLAWTPGSNAPVVWADRPLNPGVERWVPRS